MDEETGAKSDVLSITGNKEITTYLHYLISYMLPYKYFQKGTREKDSV